MVTADILYVSVDRDACELVPQLLRQHPWRVQCVHTSTAALKTARERPFDIYLLSNWWLDDGVHGVELSLRLRHQDPFTPVLFYSSNASAKDVDAALAAGAVGYIVKPDVEGILERKIYSTLASSVSKSHEARFEEVRTICDEVSSHLSQIQVGAAERAGALVEKNSERLSNSFRLLLKAKAKIAFFNAGGTRSHFERMWPGTLEEAIERIG